MNRYVRSGLHLALAVAAAGLMTLPSAAQPAGGSPGYPRWTGAAFPADQHLAVMLLHFDDAAIAMARDAQRDAADADLKRLAATVISERTKERETLRAAYGKRYGAAPPAWPGVPGGPSARSRGYGYGPGMMGGGYGPGMMRGGYGPAMMGYGDAYQLMMGERVRSAGTAPDGGASFVPALLRLDGMEIAMASLALDDRDSSLRASARRIVSSCGAEVTRLSAR